MVNFIKNLFSGFLAFIGKLPFIGRFFSSGKQEEFQATSQNRSSLKETTTQAATQVKETTTQAATQVKETAAQAATQVKETAAQAALFLSGDDARGFKSPNGSQSPEKEKATQSTATAKAFNLSKPKVTTYANFSNYGDRRRPGANMSDFLEMARKMKTS